MSRGTGSRHYREKEQYRERIAELEAENQRLREWQSEAAEILPLPSDYWTAEEGDDFRFRRAALLKALQGEGGVMDDRRMQLELQEKIYLKAENDRLRAENERLREALERYGRHDSDCAFIQREGVQACNCGWEQAYETALQGEGGVMGGYFIEEEIDGMETKDIVDELNGALTRAYNAEKENERLRDALERLASEDYYGNYPVTQGTAREALEGGE